MKHLHHQLKIGLWPGTFHISIFMFSNEIKEVLANKARGFFIPLVLSEVQLEKIIPVNRNVNSRKAACITNTFN